MVARAILPLALCISVETAEHLAFSRAGTHSRRRAAWTALGIGLHVALLGLWCWLLVLMPLGVATPLTGASYLTIALASQVWLGETVGARGWVGVCGIVLGFALIASQ